MNEHLTEQQLIDYQFKLASDEGITAAGSHLESCDACRRRLESLQRKFASLDLLRREVALSEDLLARTVQQAGGPRARPRSPLVYRLPWLGAVAAAVIVGLAVLLPGPGTGRKPTEPPVRQPGESATTPEPETERLLAFQSDQFPTPPGRGRSDDDAPEKGRLVPALTTVAPMALKGAEDEPPFALR